MSLKCYARPNNPRQVADVGETSLSLTDAGGGFYVKNKSNQ